MNFLMNQNVLCLYPLSHLGQSFNGGKIFGPPVQHALIKFLFLRVITLLPLLLFPLSILVIILLVQRASLTTFVSKLNYIRSFSFDSEKVKQPQNLSSPQL